MGKRKTKRKPQKKTKDKLDTQFNCVFCNHDNSIICKMDNPNKVGFLKCKQCDITWQCTINKLDEPVDVYSSWIDACESVNLQKPEKAAQKPREATRDDSRTPPPRSYSEDRLDPFDEDENDDDDDY